MLALYEEHQEQNIQNQIVGVVTLERVMKRRIFPETAARQAASVIGRSLPVAPSSSADPAVLVSPNAPAWHGRAHVEILLYLASEVQVQKTQAALPRAVEWCSCVLDLENYDVSSPLRLHDDAELEVQSPLQPGLTMGTGSCGQDPCPGDVGVWIQALTKLHESRRRPQHDSERALLVTRLAGVDLDRRSYLRRPALASIDIPLMTVAGSDHGVVCGRVAGNGVICR